MYPDAYAISSICKSHPLPAASHQGAEVQVFPFPGLSRSEKVFQILLLQIPDFSMYKSPVHVYSHHLLPNISFFILHLQLFAECHKPKPVYNLRKQHDIFENHYNFSGSVDISIIKSRKIFVLLYVKTL